MAKSPAMAIGVSARLWTLTETVEQTSKRGRYRGEGEMIPQELIARSQADYANFMFWWYADLGVIVTLYIIAFLRRCEFSGAWA